MKAFNQHSSLRYSSETKGLQLREEEKQYAGGVVWKTKKKKGTSIREQGGHLKRRKTLVGVVPLELRREGVGKGWAEKFRRLLRLAAIGVEYFEVHFMCNIEEKRWPGVGRQVEEIWRWPEEGKMGFSAYYPKSE